MNLSDVIKKKIGRDTDLCFFDSSSYHLQNDYEDLDTYEEIVPIITDNKEIKKK